MVASLGSDPEVGANIEKSGLSARGTAEFFRGYEQSACRSAGNMAGT